MQRKRESEDLFSDSAKRPAFVYQAPIQNGGRGNVSHPSSGPRPHPPGPGLGPGRFGSGTPPALQRTQSADLVRALNSGAQLAAETVNGSGVRGTGAAASSPPVVGVVEDVVDWEELAKIVSEDDEEEHSAQILASQAASQAAPVSQSDRSIALLLSTKVGGRLPDANTVAQDAEIRILREKLEANSKREQEEIASRERDKRAELDRLEGLVREARRDADGLRSQMAFKDQARPHHDPFYSSLAPFLLYLLSST